MRGLTVLGLILVTFQASAASQCLELFLLADQTTHGVPLIEVAYQSVQIHTKPSPGRVDPLIEEARELKIVDDFKWLSDLRPKNLSEAEKINIQKEAASLRDRRAEVEHLIKHLYESGTELLDAPVALTRAQWSLDSNTAPAQTRNTAEKIERTWARLVKRTPPKSSGSLIPVPFPVIIPGSRFQESYYWDSYLAIKGLLTTGRWKLATMQVENFLFMIEKYGLVPNGLRDYYLSRSQPPLLSSMIRDVVEHARSNREVSTKRLQTWIRERAYPLLQKDYHNFWMNPKTHYDSATGLNRFWDTKDEAREERSAHDNDRVLGKSYRHVRAEAASGRDFTDAYGGEATNVAPVFLNAVMYRMENDLAWMARESGDNASAARYTAAAENRKATMHKLMRDPLTGAFHNYHLINGQRLDILTADIYGLLWANMVTPAQAKQVHESLRSLHFNGGIAGSNVVSGKQWDGPYGWAPDQFFAMDGLLKYGMRDQAVTIGANWTNTIDRINALHDVLLEKVDVVRADRPIETGNKYTTQEGFLWTNAIYLWTQVNVLGTRLVPIKP